MAYTFEFNTAKQFTSTLNIGDSVAFAHPEQKGVQSGIIQQISDSIIYISGGYNFSKNTGLGTRHSKAKDLVLIPFEGMSHNLHLRQ